MLFFSYNHVYFYGESFKIYWLGFTAPSYNTRNPQQQIEDICENDYDEIGKSENAESTLLLINCSHGYTVDQPLSNKTEEHGQAPVLTYKVYILDNLSYSIAEIAFPVMLQINKLIISILFPDYLQLSAYACLDAIDQLVNGFALGFAYVISSKVSEILYNNRNSGLAKAYSSVGILLVMIFGFIILLLISMNRFCLPAFMINNLGSQALLSQMLYIYSFYSYI